MAPEFFNSALNRKIPTGEVKKKHEITTINTLYFYLIGVFPTSFCRWDWNSSRILTGIPSEKQLTLAIDLPVALSKVRSLWNPPTMCSLSLTNATPQWNLGVGIRVSISQVPWSKLNLSIVSMRRRWLSWS